MCERGGGWDCGRIRRIGWVVEDGCYILCVVSSIERGTVPRARFYSTFRQFEDTRNMREGGKSGSENAISITRQHSFPFPAREAASHAYIRSMYLRMHIIREGTYRVRM